MNRYYDMTHEQLLAVTEKDIETLIEIEIAHKGIMPIECPTPPDIGSAGIAKDHVAYNVKGMLFAKKEDALAVAAMSILGEEYDYSGAGYNYKWLDPVINPDVAEVSYYKQADVVRVQQALIELKKKKDAYECKKGEYDKYMKSTGDIRNDVWATITNVREKEQELTLARRTYKKHLELAGNDADVAQKFFCDAYRERQDIITAMGFAPVQNEVDDDINQSELQETKT